MSEMGRVRSTYESPTEIHGSTSGRVLPDAGWCEWCAGLGDWWEGPLGQRVHVVCTYCRGQGEYPTTPAGKESDRG